MKILVLLSTWNGEKYLRQQLASILSQKVDGAIEVLVRDDGSSDDTVAILHEMNDGRMRIIEGENLGAKASFMALIHEASRSSADLVALADQDDIWLPEKLTRAAGKLNEASGPALYCSALNLVDEQLQSLGKYQYADSVSFESSFFVNCATGCTCVINRDLLNLLSEQPDTEEIIMHDWWLYLVAATFGKVIYDQESYILYRQHAMNQVGMRTGFANFVYRTKNFFRRLPTPSRLTQAREFQRKYEIALPAPHKLFLAQLFACSSNPKARLHFALNHRPRRRTLYDEMISLFTFVLGRI